MRASLVYQKGDEKNNPAIVRIESASDNSSELTIIFFGASGPIAEIESLSSSGSGWGYGATVSVTCTENPQEHYILTSY